MASLTGKGDPCTLARVPVRLFPAACLGVNEHEQPANSGEEGVKVPAGHLPIFFAVRFYYYFICRRIPVFESCEMFLFLSKPILLFVGFLFLQVKF